MLATWSKTTLSCNGKKTAKFKTFSLFNCVDIANYVIKDAVMEVITISEQF